MRLTHRLEAFSRRGRCGRGGNASCRSPEAAPGKSRPAGEATTGEAGSGDARSRRSAPDGRTAAPDAAPRHRAAWLRLVTGPSGDGWRLRRPPGKPATAAAIPPAPGMAVPPGTMDADRGAITVSGVDVPGLFETRIVFVGGRNVVGWANGCDRHAGSRRLTSRQRSPWQVAVVAAPRHGAPAAAATLDIDP